MKKLFNWLKKIKAWVWVVLAVVIVAVLLFGLPALRARSQAQATLYQTSAAARGSLVASVGATGTVRARQTAILTWQTSGTVGVVKVQPGDKVQAGDTLATLAQTSLPQNVILAQADLVSAQKALNDLLNSKSAAAQAQLTLANAQKNLSTTQSNYTSQTSQRAGLTTINDAKAQIVLANQQVDYYQGKYNDTAGMADDNVTRATAYTNLYNAIKNRDRLVANYNWMIGHPNAQDQSVLDAQLALAKAQVADAQREWDRLKNGPDGNDIRAAQARVDATQAAVQTAQVRAPFAGTVTEVNGLVGDQVTPGTKAFRIDDLSRMLVDVQVSEVDINSVQIGQGVTLTFDAILGKSYTGQVVEVAQAGDVSQGAVNFTVTAELTDADPQVKPGMTAAVTIVTKQLDNVLLVPNRAVRLVNNQRVVYVLRAGQPVEIQITIGASSDTVSEVVSGDLKVGDQIILNPASNILTNRRGGGGGGGLFGGGGG